jgi:hypothetical protein
LNLKFKDVEKYYFKWFPQVGLDSDPIAYTVLPLGFGPIYNTANIDNNAGWQIKEKTFIFRAEKDIQKDEEIRTFYGYFLTENGGIFNCDAVFNLAFDTYNGQSKLKMVRFGNLEHFEASKTNPSYARIAQLLAVAPDGLTLSRIVAVLADGQEKAAFDFPPDSSLSLVYGKIAEFRNSQFQLFKLVFSFKNVASGQDERQEVLIRK